MLHKCLLLLGHMHGILASQETVFFLIYRPSDVVPDRAFIFLRSVALCIPNIAVLWNEMATNMNPPQELMKNGRKRKTSLLEATLLIFIVSYLTGRERTRSEEERRARASPGPRQMWRLLYLPDPISCSCSKNKAAGGNRILFHFCKVQMRHMQCYPLGHTNEHLHNQ